MKLITWLEAKRGRAKALAAHLHVSSATVSEWANERKPVPVDRCAPVEAFTGREVTRPELRDDWRTHWPELITAGAGVAGDRRDPAAVNEFPDLDRRAAAHAAGETNGGTRPPLAGNC